MEKIKVQIANTQELRGEAFDFFSKRIFDSYGNIPSPTSPEMEILVAIIDGEIVATIGLFFGNSDEELPHRKLYSFSNLNHSAKTRVCFISRWTASENKAGIVLSYISARYILSKGATLGFSVLKPQVASYLNRFSNNSWVVVEDAILQRDNVLPEDSNYFSSEPTPRLYTANIKEYFDGLNMLPGIHKSMENVEIKIQ